MIIDAHQHFWHYNVKEYPWIDDRMKVLQRDFLPADLEKELGKLNIEGTIAVQARQCLEETRWLLKLSEEHDFIKGIVGWVDLCSADLTFQLEEFAQHPKFVGVRHVVHDERDERFMARRDFQQGIGMLAEYNLTYDLLIFPKHLALAAELVSLFPDQVFVLDHIAKPNIKDGIHAPWDKGIMKLAQNSNVYCKLSGMVTEGNWNDWKPNDFTYYLDMVFEAFGPDAVEHGSVE